MNLQDPDPRTSARTAPSHLVPFASAEEVRRRVARLGVEIGTWAAEVTAATGRQPLAVCLLRGGVFFFSDLLLSCPASVEPAFCRCRAYRPGENGVQADSVEMALDAPPLEGRHVLVVDDICDSGRTLAAVTRLMGEQGAAEVVAAVCVHRRRSDGFITPRWSAFDHDGPEWFAGYGMEDASHFMNYPGLYLIRPG